MSKKQKHSTEYQLRVEEIADCIQEGMRAKEIEVYFGKRYRLLPRQIRNYIKDAKKILYQRQALEGNDDIDKAKERAVKRRLKIFNKAWELEDLKICLQAEDSIAKIQGIFTPTVPSGEIEGKEDIPPYMQMIENMSPTALKQFIKTGNIPGGKKIRLEGEIAEEDLQKSKETIH